MTEQARMRRSLRQIENDCNAAIDRLLAGRPTEPTLIKLSARGRLKITFESVALEAPCSRTLLSLEKCRLPQVRKRIQKIESALGTNLETSDRHAELKEQIKALTNERDLALQMQQEHFLAREVAEREASKWRDAYKRLKEQSERTTTVVKPLRPV